MHIKSKSSKKWIGPTYKQTNEDQYFFTRWINLTTRRIKDGQFLKIVNQHRKARKGKKKKLTSFPFHNNHLYILILDMLCPKLVYIYSFISDLLFIGK